jgi:hypothetical protein
MNDEKHASDRNVYDDLSDKNRRVNTSFETDDKPFNRTDLYYDVIDLLEALKDYANQNEEFTVANIETIQSYIETYQWMKTIITMKPHQLIELDKRISEISTFIEDNPNAGAKDVMNILSELVTLVFDEHNETNKKEETETVKPAKPDIKKPDIRNFPLLVSHQSQLNDVVNLINKHIKMKQDEIKHLQDTIQMMDKKRIKWQEKMMHIQSTEEFLNLYEQANLRLKDLGRHLKHNKVVNLSSNTYFLKQLAKSYH